DQDAQRLHELIAAALHRMSQGGDVHGTPGYTSVAERPDRPVDDPRWLVRSGRTRRVRRFTKRTERVTMTHATGGSRVRADRRWQRPGPGGAGTRVPAKAPCPALGGHLLQRLRRLRHLPRPPPDPGEPGRLRI